MKKNDDLAVIVFTVAMAGAVALAVANDVTKPVCELAKSASGKAFVGCLEFWVERYQTLFAAAVSVGVALYVVRPVFQQLRAMNAQSAVGAKQIAESFAAAIDAEIAALQEIETGFWFVESYLGDFVKPAARAGIITKEEAEEATKVIRDIDNAVSVIKTADRQQLAEVTINDTRRVFLEATAEHRRKCVAITTRIASWSTRAVDEVKQKQRDETLARRLEEAGKTHEEFESKCSSLRKALEALSRQKWADVRRFEKAAQGIEE